MNPILKRETNPNKLQPGKQDHSPSSPSDLSLDQWVDKYEIMKEFKLSERTLYTLRKNKELPFAKLGKTILYNRTKLELRLRKLSGIMMLLLHIIFSVVSDMGTLAGV